MSLIGTKTGPRPPWGDTFDRLVSRCNEGASRDRYQNSTAPRCIVIGSTNLRREMGSRRWARGSKLTVEADLGRLACEVRSARVTVPNSGPPARRHARPRPHSDLRYRSIRREVHSMAPPRSCTIQQRATNEKRISTHRRDGFDGETYGCRDGRPGPRTPGLRTRSRS